MRGVLQNVPFHTLSMEQQTKKEVFDLVHVRDGIQHLTLNQGLKYYCNVFLSGARILVTTSYKAKVNIDIQEGGLL